MRKILDPPLETPYERVRSYVKEQSDSLHQSLSSPIVSELMSDRSQIAANRASYTTPLVITSYTPDLTTSNPPVLTPVDNIGFAPSSHQFQAFRFETINNVRLPQASSNTAFPQNVYHQSIPLYTFPFLSANPMCSNTNPRVSIPLMSEYPRNRTLHHTIPSVSEDNVMQPPASRQNNESLTRLADLLTERRGKGTLPIPEPEIFRGDLLHFPRWIKSFETIIQSLTKRAMDRLFYLGRYTVGEPKDAIAGYITQNATEAYDTAKALLWKRYGNPFLVAEAYKKKIQEWLKISPNDSTGLHKLSDFFNQTLTAMSFFTFLNVLHDPSENRRMVRKLPTFVIGRWSRLVDKYIFETEPHVLDSEIRRQNFGYPSFAEFCQFVEKEARIAYNPLISVQVFKSEEVKRPRRSDADISKLPSVKTLQTKTDEVRKSTGPSKMTSIYCKEENDHNLSVRSLWKYQPLIDVPLLSRNVFAGGV